MKGDTVYAVTIVGNLIKLFAHLDDAENYIKEVLLDKDNMVIMNYREEDIFLDIMTIQ